MAVVRHPPYIRQCLIRDIREAFTPLTHTLGRSKRAKMCELEALVTVGCSDRVSQTPDSLLEPIFHTMEEQEQRLEPQHRCNNVFTCEMISIGMENQLDMAEIMEAGEIALVTYSPVNSDKRSLRIQRKKPRATSPSIAISHVRAQGLGNSTESALPRCAVEWLQGLVDDMYDASDRPVPFFIDTLCVPARTPERKSAIRCLRHTFAECDKVLVLDSALYNAAVESPAEQLHRLRSIAWRTRLWTLQEGAVAKALYFRFKSSVTQLESLLEACKPSNLHLSFPKEIQQQELEQRSPNSGYLKLLDLFDDDVKLFEASQPELSSSTSNKKYQLRAVLRLGYLSFSRLWYFATSEELKILPSVASAIKFTYGVELEHGNSSHALKKRHALLRLRKLIDRLLVF